MRRVVVLGLALLTGLVLAAGSPRESAAASESADIIICGRYLNCVVLPPAPTCTTLPITEIWSIHNRSALTVELHNQSGCWSPLVIVFPGSSCSGPITAYLYRTF